MSSGRHGRTIYWLDLAFNAPLCAINKRWPSVLHAVEMKGLPGPGEKKLATSVCGRSGLRVVGWGDAVVTWPPAVKGLSEAGHTRCRECFMACKKKRPRSRWVPQEVAS